MNRHTRFPAYQLRRASKRSSLACADYRSYGHKEATFIYSNVYPANYRNDSFSVAVSYPLTAALDLKLPVYVDRLKHAGQSGTRITGGPLLDYNLSKRTDVYAGVDYTRLTGAWTTLAGTSGFTLPISGRNSVFEATVGLRHKF